MFHFLMRIGDGIFLLLRHCFDNLPVKVFILELLNSHIACQLFYISLDAILVRDNLARSAATIMQLWQKHRFTNAYRKLKITKFDLTFQKRKVLFYCLTVIYSILAS
jgi:hypothetical protein